MSIRNARCNDKDARRVLISPDFFLNIISVFFTALLPNCFENAIEFRDVKQRNSVVLLILSILYFVIEDFVFWRF